ncbi:DUF4381 domain-containing protein [Pseudomonas vancouverensis]|uniref:DUF4381 domain-containing protein n=1 Tax=Pseudomonas vancouverensis TaxID=95300 RepID=UPI003CFFFE52
MNPDIPSIDQLKEIPLPAPVSYAPQTWGWWVLLGLLVMTVLIVAARRYWQWRRDRYRREALLRLAQLQKRSDDLNALRELPQLLKRTALSMPAAHPVGASLLAMASRHLTLKASLPTTPPISTWPWPASPAWKHPRRISTWATFMCAVSNSTRPSPPTPRR